MSYASLSVYLTSAWNHLCGRVHHTLFRMVEANLAPLNIALASTCHQAQKRRVWSLIVGTATSAIEQVTR